ncbi:MAG: DUF523 domain-containing protein [Planctomycetaceae bacterium]|nr:DUF523 domain-containing protein [Planctomycetaceae bacterium]
MDTSLTPVLVSACLLGRACRYDGGHNRDVVLDEQLAARGERAVPVCPEDAGGLGTPRPAAWMTGAAAEVLAGCARVVDVHGRDVTAQFVAGADLAVEVARAAGARRAYLKERSPSCGVAASHRVNGAGASEAQSGPGVTAQRLLDAGLEVHGVEGRRVHEDHDEHHHDTAQRNAADPNAQEQGATNRGSDAPRNEP